MLIPADEYARIIRMIPIPCVDLAVVNPAREIFLVQRKNEPARGEWWFPGGRVHFGETRHDAAVRKLHEECGLTPASLREIGTFDLILDLHETNNISHGITTLFLVEWNGNGEVRLDEQSDQFEWHKVNDWMAMTLHPFITHSLSLISV